jgi:zinc protease
LFKRALIFAVLTILAAYPRVLSSPKIEFDEFDLKNGLHVILHKDTTNPLVNINIWYHVGSKDEDTNKTGFAHLFEHMMFQGSKNVGKAEHFMYIQKAGGTLNGSTNQDRTNYFETVPSNQLELALWLESDRMGSLNVTQENFDNQREVVKEEKRQRYDNVPYGSRFANMFEREFTDHPYHWITIGSLKDLSNANLSYAQNFYKRFYTPNNAVIVISGNIQYDETKKLVEKYFGDLKPAPFKKNRYPENLFHEGEKKDTVYDNVHLPAIYIGYKIPAVTSKDIYPLMLLSSILGEGRSSRLYRNLVYDKQAARSARCMVWDLELAGLMIFSSTGFKNSNLLNIEDLIDEQIQLIRDNPVSDYELQKAKNSAESDFVNRLQTMHGIAELLASYWTYYKNTGMINTDLDNIMTVTAEDIRQVANKFLINDNRVVLYYLPKQNAEEQNNRRNEKPEILEDQ